MLRLLSHALVLLIVVDAASRIKEIQQDFLNSFQSRCSKYLFVTKWMKMLDDPPKKVIHRCIHIHYIQNIYITIYIILYVTAFGFCLPPRGKRHGRNRRQTRWPDNSSCTIYTVSSLLMTNKTL